ncbi:endonuclease-3 [Bradyrhizobium sp. LM3.4]
MAKITRKPAPRKAPVPKKKAKAVVAKPKAPAKKSLKATKPWTPAEVHEVFSRFRKANPEPKGELEHVNPFTLLVAVVLSAQATDAGVNKATRALFEIADTPQKMLDLGEERLREYIKTIGLYRTKARNVIALSAKVLSEFGGEVPCTRAEIESLPGAGRKTANVVLNMAFGEHTMAVDTHVFRVGNRTELAPGKTPLEVELWSRKADPGRIHAPRPSLADPARSLYLPRAQAALRGVPDQRSLPMAGKDGLSENYAVIRRLG